jgi:hypothetical protein
MVIGIVGLVVLSVLGGFAIQCLLQAIFLRLAARFCNVEGATFRRAFATAVVLSIILIAIEFGVWVVLPASPDTGQEGVHNVTLHLPSQEFPLNRGKPAAFETVVIMIAAGGSILASISLIKSGFQTTVIKAIGVWFFSLVLMMGTVVLLIVFFVLAVFAVIAPT